MAGRSRNPRALSTFHSAEAASQPATTLIASTVQTPARRRGSESATVTKLTPGRSLQSFSATSPGGPACGVGKWARGHRGDPAQAEHHADTPAEIGRSLVSVAVREEKRRQRRRREAEDDGEAEGAAAGIYTLEAGEGDDRVTWVC